MTTFVSLRIPAAFALTSALLLAPLPVLAAPPAEAAPPATPATTAEPAAAPTPMPLGGNVGLLKFEGADADAWRFEVKTQLEDKGYRVTGVKKSYSEATAAAKCKGNDEACLAPVAAYLQKGTKTPFDFFVYAQLADHGETAVVAVYDIKNGKLVRKMTFTRSADDLMAPLIVPRSVATSLVDYQAPPPPMSDEEKATLAALDEPAKTAEELAQEQKLLADAQEAARRAYNENLDVGAQSVDLRKDFKELCRTGKREDVYKETPEGERVLEARDYRPACKLGPTFGYFQARSWILFGLTSIGALATVGMYSGALGTRLGPYRGAKDDLDAAIDAGLDPNAPADADEYANLAGEVSEYGHTVRNLALGGDIALGTSLLFGVVLVILIADDRKEAREALSRDKELKMSDFRVSPIMGRGTYGVGAGFRF